LTNAAKYTDPAGRIELSVTHADGQVAVQVSDNGTGIDPKLLPRVFDLFVQGYQSSDRSTGGLGLGLALVRSLVVQHGGTVEVQPGDTYSVLFEGFAPGATVEVRLQSDPIVVGSLSADETVLIHNAGGGVGLAAIDIGRHVGARLIGTASPGKHAFLKERGLHEAIDYTSGDWLPELMRMTDGRGAELILDPLGGSHWKKSYKALRHTGRLGMFGISSAAESRLPGPLKLVGMAAGLPLFNPISLMNSNRAVFGVNMGHLWHEVDKIRLWADALVAGVEDGWVRPHVDKVFPLAQAGEAQAYIEARRNTGKVILEP
jgi:NADPH:quinone reductase-like Zn-dependent oxidoreductase